MNAIISKVKNQLSQYIETAKSGEDIIIYDRNTPVALLTRYVHTETDSLLERLSREGILSRGLGKIPPDLLKPPSPDASDVCLHDYLISERNEGF